MRINPEKKEERERVTSALLRVTLQLASAHGFASLGLREVARAADIAPTSFYRHFADMEELGLSLIEDLAAGFLRDWLERARTGADGATSSVLAIARAGLSSAREQPELMRFILAERFGAIPGFRTALDAQIGIVIGAVREAMKTELPGLDAPEFVADAVVVLILEACGQALNRGPEDSSARTDGLFLQIQTLVAGAAAGSAR